MVFSSSSSCWSSAPLGCLVNASARSEETTSTHPLPQMLGAHANLHS
jgi:hypothetical protein